MSGPQSLFRFKKGRTETDQARLFLGFLAGGQAYALEVGTVREIVRIPKITSLPKVPSFVKGVIDLRGSILPILDLREKLGLGTVDLKKGRAVVMVPGGACPIGLLVDSVLEVLKSSPEDILDPPSALRQSELAFIESVLRTPERLYYLIRPDSILTEKEFLALEAGQWTAHPQAGP